MTAFTPFRSWLVFGGLLALVINIQLGSGIFMLPSQLAPYGGASLLVWSIACLGAMILSLGFGLLCGQNQQASAGPSWYIQQAFGWKAGFASSWAYWFVSWFSSLALVTTAAGSLQTLPGPWQQIPTLWVELLILGLATGLNWLNFDQWRIWNMALVLMKVLPLIALPLWGWWALPQATWHWPALDGPQILHGVLLTFWGFIGLEAITTAQGALHQPSKTLGKALVLGTGLVACLYVGNTALLVGHLSPTQLANHPVPHSLLLQQRLGIWWGYGISFLILWVCFCTLQSWIFTVSQISLVGSQQGFFPRFFQRKNKGGVPFLGAALPSLGCIPLLWALQHHGFAHKLQFLISESVAVFLWIYAASMGALLRGSIQARQGSGMVLGALGLVFCLTLLSILPIGSFLLSIGVPLALSLIQPRFWMGPQQPSTIC